MSTPTRLVVGPGEPDNEEFGAFLRRSRTEAGLSRRETADAYGLSSEYIRLIERGERTPVSGSVPKLAAAYGLPFHTVDSDAWSIGGVEVKFTSRVQEPRHKETEAPSRDTQIGQIVRLLTTADDATLRAIYLRLLRG